MQLKTQISGKYSIEDGGVFSLKKKLIEAGITVFHPICDKIIGFDHGVPISFVKHKGLSLFDVELDYYNCIKSSPFHIVYNCFKTTMGYIGGSVSLEITYAIVFNRPIIICFNEIALNKAVQKKIAEIIIRNKKNFIHISLQDLSKEKILSRVGEVSYDITPDEEAFVLDSVNDILLTYKHFI